MKQLSPQYLALGSFTGSLIIFDIIDNSVKINLDKVTKSGIYALETHVDDQFLSVSSDNKIRLWKDFKIESEQEVPLCIKNDKLQGMIKSGKNYLVFSHEGQVLELDEQLKAKNHFFFSKNPLLNLFALDSLSIGIDTNGNLIDLEKKELIHSFGKKIVCSFTVNHKVFAFNYSNLLYFDL